MEEGGRVNAHSWVNDPSISVFIYTHPFVPCGSNGLWCLGCRTLVSICNQYFRVRGSLKIAQRKTVASLTAEAYSRYVNRPERRL